MSSNNCNSFSLFNPLTRADGLYFLITFLMLATLMVVDPEYELKGSSTCINRKDDSKWLIAIRNNDEFAKLLDPYRYYFVLFEFESIYDSNNNDIIASIWEVDPKSKGFAYCMIDYYLNIRSQSTSKAPFNMWPHMLKFALTEPTLIYRSKITNDGNIITDVFPSKNNTYSDVDLHTAHSVSKLETTAPQALQDPN